MAGPRGGPFDVLVCQECLAPLQSAKQLKIHYLGHYRSSLAATHPSLSCSLCPATAQDQEAALTHLVTAHARLVSHISRMRPPSTFLVSGAAASDGPGRPVVRGQQGAGGGAGQDTQVSQ